MLIPAALNLTASVMQAGGGPQQAFKVPLWNKQLHSDHRGRPTACVGHGIAAAATPNSRTVPASLIRPLPLLT